MGFPGAITSYKWSYFTLRTTANGAHLLWFLFIILLQKAQVRVIWSYDLDVENPVSRKVRDPTDSGGYM